MFCYKCGNQLEDDAVFCPFCGAKNDEEAENQSAVEVNNNYDPPQTKKGAPWKLIISSAVIAAAVIIVFSVGKNRDKDNISAADINSKANIVMDEYAEDAPSAEEINTTAQTTTQTTAEVQNEPAPADKPSMDSEKEEQPSAEANGAEAHSPSDSQKIRTNYGEYNGYSPDEGKYISRNGWFLAANNECVLLKNGETLSFQAQFDSFGPDKYIIHVSDSDYKEIMTFEFNYGEPESGDFFDPDDPIADCCGASMRITDSVLPLKAGSASMGESYSGSDDFHPEWFKNSYIEVEYIDKETVRWPTIVMSFSATLNDGNEDMSINGYLAATW